MPYPRFEELPHQDRNLIELIVDKAKRESAGTNSTIDQAAKTDLVMDLCCFHLGHGLRLDDMWKGPMFDVLHDVHGIHCHLNRSTGEMENCFLPRCSKAPDLIERDDDWQYTESTRHKNRYVILTRKGEIKIDGVHGEAIARRIVIEHNADIRKYDAFLAE